MEDNWLTYAAQMGENQAWITFNQGYAESADADARTNCLQIRVAFRNPTDYGLPTNEEFPALCALDESLDTAITAAGGVYVGRIAVGGHRYFYYYADGREQSFTALIDRAAEESGYRLQHLWEPDPDKKNYWDDLYPTADDWRVIKDLGVLEALGERGDNKDTSREVLHWAYFPSSESAEGFKSWVLAQSYKLIHVGPADGGDGEDYLVQYSHSGTMSLGDITHHTIGSGRKARELGGRYDGWETSVET